MKLFISWSGTKSHAAAQELKEFLQDVVQAVEPWMSSKDIEKGARWAHDIAAQLDELSQGIVVVTQGNQNAPWLNFEAGALAKEAATSRVRTVLVDLTPTDVTGPLTAFQHTSITAEEDMRSMVKELNSSCERPVPEEAVLRSFSRAWEEFQQKIKRLPAEKNASPQRSMPEMVTELLEIVRGLERRAARASEESGSFQMHTGSVVGLEGGRARRRVPVQGDLVRVHGEEGVARVRRVASDGCLMLEFERPEGRVGLRRFQADDSRIRVLADRHRLLPGDRGGDHDAGNDDVEPSTS